MGKDRTKMGVKKYISPLALIVSLIFSVTSCCYSKNSNEISQKANEISQKAIEQSEKANEISQRVLAESHKANEISEKANELVLESASISIVEDAYSELYEIPRNREIVYILKNRDGRIPDINELTTFVSILEGVGGQYCNGFATEKQIRFSLGKTLDQVVCRNKQVIEVLGGKMNGLAMLCNRFSLNSGFGNLVRTDGFKDCNFQP